MVRFDVLLVPISRALSVKAQLNGEIELLRFERARSKENPFETDVQLFEILSISCEDHFEQFVESRRDFFETAANCVDGDGTVKIFRIKDVQYQDDPEEDTRRFFENFGPERFGVLRLAQPKFRLDVLLDVVYMPDFVFQRNLDALFYDDSRIVPAREADPQLNTRVFGMVAELLEEAHHSGRLAMVALI